MISKDRNNYPLVQVSRIDRQRLVCWGSARVLLKFEIGRFGLIVRVGGGLVFKAHRLLYHSTLGLRVIKKNKVGGGRRAFPSMEAYILNPEP